MVANGADWLHMDVMVSGCGKPGTSKSSPVCVVGHRHVALLLELRVVVQDGHFVPNLTLGAPIIKALRKHTTAFLDCHLMVTDPERWVDAFQAAGASQFTFHIEATRTSPVFQ